MLSGLYVVPRMSVVECFRNLLKSNNSSWQWFFMCKYAQRLLDLCFYYSLFNCVFRLIFVQWEIWHTGTNDSSPAKIASSRSSYWDIKGFVTGITFAPYLQHLLLPWKLECGTLRSLWSSVGKGNSTYDLATGRAPYRDT